MCLKVCHGVETEPYLVWCPCTILRPDFDWTDPSSVMWATQKLLEVRPLLGEDCEHKERECPNLGVALSTGLGIDS